MGSTTKTLYETDFAEWAGHTADLIRSGRFDEIEFGNVAEEMASLSRAEHSAAESQLERLLHHKIKQLIQPERDGASWQVSIAFARHEILRLLKASPSLRPFLEQNLQQVYQDAIELALIETKLEQAAVPGGCPWSLDELLR